mmetsp:Transcript_5926/g.5308  ORF Transcript_5926/g.5308 Transcript_5926/m.5308 type:complete len:205 (+) Transcript_5926:95-709(+)
MTDIITEEIATDYQEGDENYNNDMYEGFDENDETHDISDDVKKQAQELDDELDKLNKIQQNVERQISSASDAIDEKSVYIGQVDYEATPDELRAHFAPCGTINRVTIMCDKFTGHPKGFAYIEFVDKESVENALKLDESVFKDRQLKVLPKRQNMPISVLRGRGRGRGRGFIRGRGAPRGRSFRGGRGGPIRGRGRSFHGSTYY